MKFVYLIHERDRYENSRPVTERYGSQRGTDVENQTADRISKLLKIRFQKAGVKSSL